MRCLALADELKIQGAEVTFVSRGHIGNTDSEIEKRGYPVLSLPVPTKNYIVRSDDVAHASWLGVSWEQDADDTCSVIGATKLDWLIVDHYSIDARWHRKLRSHASQVMVIDDLADRPLDCDVVLDQTYGRKEKAYKSLVPLGCHMLLGSRYALLRPEFFKLKSRAIKTRKTFTGINRVLVSMGGMDVDNLTAKVLDGLSLVNWSHKPVIEVILGGNAPHLHQAIALAEKSDLEISVFADVCDMAERMLTADLAIGAGGVTSWERCCLGLPALTVISAENQQVVSNALDKIGAIRLLGIGEETSAEDIKNNVERLEKNPVYLQNMSRAGFKVTDGLGVKRSVLEMIPPYSTVGKPIRLRAVTDEDTDLLFDWQSNDKTRKYAHNPDKPGYEEHRVWVRNRVEKTDAYTEVIIHGNEPSGVIRLDPVGAGAYMISIYIAPEKHCLGIGKSALSCASRLLADLELRAEIHEDNLASIALFISMGFTQIGHGKYVKKTCEVKAVYR